jgi:hypothetical protein
MKFKRVVDISVAMIAALCVASYGYAGSDRWIMTMTAERMAKTNLVFVRFFGPDGVALESASLEQMVIREQDCSSGHVFEMVKDYKMGFAPKNMQVGIYLSPFVWNNKALCFSVPNLGKIEQSLKPKANNSRIFELKMIR